MTKLSNWQQERRVMLEAFNTDRKRQYAADLDFQLWQFGADRAARSKQLSMLSPEEIALFTEQARLQAQAEGRRIYPDAFWHEKCVMLCGKKWDDFSQLFPIY
jgi:hypothetical protein